MEATPMIRGSRATPTRYKARLDAITLKLYRVVDDLREASGHLERTADSPWVDPARRVNLRGTARGLRLAAGTLEDEVLASTEDEDG